jgi:hypothetical protein
MVALSGQLSLSLSLSPSFFLRRFSPSETWVKALNPLQLLRQQTEKLGLVGGLN